MKPSKITIYYDTSCPTCTLYQSNSNQIGTWRSNTLAKDVERGSKEILVTTESGETLGGIPAIAAIEAAKGNNINAKILRIRALQPFFRLGYKILSHYRRYVFGAKAPVFWAKNLISIGLLTGTVLSLPLWLAERDFPPTSILSSASGAAFDLSLLFFGCYAAGLIWIILARKSWRWPLVLFFIGALGLVIGDLNRLRPWLWQLGLLLGILGVDSEKEQGFSLAFTIALAGGYIWGGLHKANEYFLGDVFPWFAEAWSGLIVLSPTNIFTLGLLTIILEVTIGILIITPKKRLLAGLLASALHLGIIFTLPIGHHWGFVIIPWNLALLGIVWLYTTKQRYSGPRWLTALAVLIFVALPAGNWFGITDNYLSMALYANETDRGYITVHPEDIVGLPEGAKQNIADFYGQPAVDTLMWSLTSFNTALYTSRSAYLEAHTSLCEGAQHPESMRLYLREKKRLFRVTAGQIHTCPGLQNTNN